MTSLTVADLIREGRFETAVIRMQDLVRVGDPTDPVDVEQVQREFRETYGRLREVVPPAPFKVTVEFVS